MTSRSSLLAALVAVCFTLAPSLAGAAATPPGGGGTTPPPQPITASTRLLPLRGRLPGQADGNVAIRIRLKTWPNSLFDLIPTVLLFEETQTVKVVNQEFVAWVGQNTTGGLPPEVFADHPNTGFTYSYESAPETAIGSQPASSVAYAMSLVPGSITSASTTAPAVDLSNRSGSAITATTTSSSASAGTFAVDRTTSVQPAVSATSNGSAGRGVLGISTATSGATAGVEGRSSAIAGAAGVFVNEGGGDLLQAKNTVSGGANFRVDNQGRIFVNGTQVGLGGPQGPKGDTGGQGVPGPQGPTGSGGKSTFAVCSVGSSCIGKCTGGAVIVGSSVGGCAVTASTGSCQWGGVDGVCCVCAN